MSLWGGLLVALLALLFWAARKNLIIERYLDAAAPALALSLAIGNTGALLKGKVMAGPYPWGIEFAGKYYHPDGAYMIVLLLVLFFILRRRRAKRAYEGELFAWFLLLWPAQFGCRLFPGKRNFPVAFYRGTGGLPGGDSVNPHLSGVRSKIYTSVGYTNRSRMSKKLGRSLFPVCFFHRFNRVSGCSLLFCAAVISD